MADPISSIPGITSGIDWTSVVDQTITAQKAPETRMQATIDANGKKKDALELLRQAMSAMQTAADGLRSGKALDAFSVTATGNDADGRNVLAATVGSGAIAGSYDVDVTALATAQKNVATTGWNATQKLSASAKLTLGGQSVDLAQGDTLAAIRDKINAQSGKTGVQASILSIDAAGADQRLVLTGQKTGAANGFAVADTASGALVAELGLGGTNTVDAGDAAFTLDGGATTIKRPSNLVTDVVPGVTLSLTAKGTSSVIVDRQPTAGADAVQAFVDGYNKVQSLLKSQLATGGALQNEPMVRTIGAQLSIMTFGDAARVDDSGNATAVAADMTALGNLGVAVQKDGTLAFDKTKFDAVYPSRMNDVRAVLGDRMQAFFYYADGMTGSYTGQIDKREAAMQTQNVTTQSRIDELNSRLDKQRTALLAKYAKFEAALAKMKSVGDSLTSQFNALNNSNSQSN